MWSAYVTQILTVVLIYVILAVSLNVAFGYTGLINLGHVGLFGIGAYTSALLTIHGMPFLLALAMAGFLSAFCGWLLITVTNKLRGDYFALATLGFNFVVVAILLNWESLTRGPIGLPGIPRPHIFGWYVLSGFDYLILTGIIAIVTVLFFRRLLSSRYGRVLEAVRDDPEGAAALGKNVFRLRAECITLSAFSAGVAGSLFAHFIQFIDPYSFHLPEIVISLTVVIVGGLASIRGSVIGAFVILTIPELLRFLDIPTSIVGPTRQIIYAAILILILLFRPRGLFGRVDLEN